jgi:hypothetical protein
MHGVAVNVNRTKLQSDVAEERGFGALKWYGSTAVLAGAR